MTFLSLWERERLSVLVDGYEEGDFNCGASEDEMKLANCTKIGGYIVNPPCDGCKFRKRFLKLKEKVRP
jgi:hypothetical protein